eukprot:8605168-Pyramimonas_sp.AAC.2
MKIRKCEEEEAKDSYGGFGAAMMAKMGWAKYWTTLSSNVIGHTMATLKSGLVDVWNSVSKEALFMRPLQIQIRDGSLCITVDYLWCIARVIKRYNSVIKAQCALGKAKRLTGKVLCSTHFIGNRGKGLGKDLQGMADHIKVVKKDDQKGVRIS